MNHPSKKCAWGPRCLVHSFEIEASKLLVRRAFELMVDANFTEDELKHFWSVAHGNR